MLGYLKSFTRVPFPFLVFIVLCFFFNDVYCCFFLNMFWGRYQHPALTATKWDLHREKIYQNRTCIDKLVELVKAAKNGMRSIVTASAVVNNAIRNYLELFAAFHTMPLTGEIDVCGWRQPWAAFPASLVTMAVAMKPPSGPFFW